MKHDKQWNPSEHHSKGYAPYQRHKLKAANWVTPEEAVAISKHCNKWNHSGIWSLQPDWRLELDLLNKYVDKPYNDFLKAWHNRTKRLRRQGVPLELNHIESKLTDNPDSREEFYVDLDGIIRVNKNYRRWRRGKEPIKVIEKEVVKYHLDDKIHSKNWCTSTPFHMILSILSHYLSVTDYNDILDGGISKEKFDRLVQSSMYSGINYAIDKFARNHNKELSKNNPRFYMGSPRYCRYDCFKDLFVADYSESVYRYIYPGSPEYSQIVAERNDASNKARREYKKQMDEYRTGLLHNIEADRKAREEEINRQKIIKHGFDENESFRGEEYHGKKHKRRKMAIDA